jgi:hypothetical protein
MAIWRQIDPVKNTAVLLYKNEPITPELNLNDPKQLWDVLTKVIEASFIKMRDAGLV